MEIRSKTQDAKSLDDVMRMLWTSHRETGYTNEDFTKTVEAVCGESYRDWLVKSLETTREMDFDKILEWYGLEWKKREPDKDALKDMPVYGNVFVGMELLAQQGKAVVDKVTRDSPASQAGFNAGDELISFDGYRVSAETWTERLNSYRPENVCKCLVARRGKIVELSIKLANEPETNWKIVRIAKPTEEQEKRWRNWLHLPEPEKTTATK